MKRIAAILVLLSIFACGQRKGANSTSSMPVGLEPGWSVRIGDEEEKEKEKEKEEPDKVPISHHWVDVHPSAYVGKVPTAKQIAQWKAEFEKVNDIDSVSVRYINLFMSPEQMMCAEDLIELLHGPMRGDFDNNDMRIQWRLLQYNGEEGATELTELKKVLQLRSTWEIMLNYEPYSQWEMTMNSWLMDDMQEFYIRLMYKVAGENLPDSIARALKAEQECALEAGSATSAAYQKIDGTPDGFNGSSYNCRIASFEGIFQDMEINALELFLCSILSDEVCDSTDFVPLSEAKSLVEKEYTVMESNFEEDEWSFPVSERIAEMEKDKSAWKAWMEQREKVSSLLAGNQKRTYDEATVGMYRHKLIMLKNRYETGSFCPAYYDEILLSYLGSTTEDILKHNFEELLKKQLNN